MRDHILFTKSIKIKGRKLNIVIWDIESSSSSTDFGSIIEIGGILVDENFKEKDRFNLRCRLPEGEIPQCMALLVNKTNVDLLTKSNLSQYQMLNQVEAILQLPKRVLPEPAAESCLHSSKTFCNFFRDPSN